MSKNVLVTLILQTQNAVLPLDDFETELRNNQSRSGFWKFSVDQSLNTVFLLVNLEKGYTTTSFSLVYNTSYICTSRMVSNLTLILLSKASGTHFFLSISEMNVLLPAQNYRHKPPKITVSFKSSFCFQL